MVLGLINAEQGSLTYPDVSIGARAAVRQVNENGGIGGRPLQLEVCPTNGTAESTIACAQKMVSQRAVAVLEGYDPTSEAKLATLAEAGIPIFGTNTIVRSVDVSPDVTLTSVPWSLSFPAALKALSERGAKNLVVIGADPGPQMLEILEKNVGAAAQALGMTASLTAYNPGSPNFAAAVSAAQAKGADSIYLSGNEAACTNGVRNARSLGFDGSIFVVNCTDYASELGETAKGVVALAALVPPSAEPTAPDRTKEDIATYRAAMDSDGADGDADSFAIYGFSSVMTVSDVLRSVDGPITAQTASPAVKAFKGDVFLGQAGVDCTQRPVPNGGSCGTEMARLEANGNGGFDMMSSSFFDVVS
ncbi:ABC transporter substrate-binding protein [Rhodococcus triatomae]|nr:putative ABC transporter substrate-binding protein [Rhodococcus triatomae BKS 15-14]